MTNYTKKEADKNGDTFYYNNKRQYHRLDGPAIEWVDGHKWWWLDGKSLTKEEFNKHPLVVEARMVRLISEVLND